MSIIKINNCNKWFVVNLIVVYIKVKGSFIMKKIYEINLKKIKNLRYNIIFIKLKW